MTFRQFYLRDYHGHISTKRDCLWLNLRRALWIIAVQTDECCVLICISYLLERITDDSRRIESDAKFKQHKSGGFIFLYKGIITLRHGVPMRIFNKITVHPDMNIHFTSAHRAMGHETRINSQVVCISIDVLNTPSIIIESVMTCPGTLHKAVVALNLEILSLSKPAFRN